MTDGKLRSSTVQVGVPAQRSREGPGNPNALARFGDSLISDGLGMGAHAPNVNVAVAMLDAVAVRAGWTAGEIRIRAFRHTYCATRLQTRDNGQPVAEYTVGRE